MTGLAILLLPRAPARLALHPAAFSDLAGWYDDDQQHALAAFRRSCAAILRLPADRPMAPDARFGRAADWRAPCLAAQALGVEASDQPALVRAFFERWFKPFAVSSNGRSTGLFTGYYEPTVDGRLTPDPAYRFALYRCPSDLVSVDLGQFRADLAGRRIAGRVVNGRLEPFAPRAAIEDGALAGRGLELVWLKSPVDAFFLHIQGSGRVRLKDGRIMRVGYAGGNGHAYHAIGRALVARGALTKKELSLQSIRTWLIAHPGKARAVMQQNPSFVFFRKLSGDGPIGAQGVVLTPGRSLAVDRAFLPLGAPVWLETTRPGVRGIEPDSLPYRRLMVAQDTGGAIRGVVRGDVFWGTGRYAEDMAGHMKQRGHYFVLLPRLAPSRGEDW
jgi:membrane-bound lytic murein transglycosylase A